DYLVFKLEDNTLKILHRTGTDRIKVTEKIDFSKNEVFLYKNKFTVTNKKGVLHQIDTKGNLTATNFNLNSDHGMYATSNTLAFMDDNVLSIKGRKVELDLGVYTKPKIFYIYDKIYVSVTDIQSQKIYLFDSQAKSIPNFPVFGNSLIDLTDMDNDRKLELVAKDQDNSLIVYKLN
ncbi:MAG: ribonuclease HII, partial [Muricauda sp.]|nr:ribonuclease HII [Allomuricauda sp.]